ncbi:hypothetical protein QFZ99_006051 [Paraburkholderia atlantica]|uniref:hypothetical protein n=1 Tax=Paraburkholderia atlantica TaxID=2654982 RepID=UPI003D1AEC06
MKRAFAVEFARGISSERLIAAWLVQQGKCVFPVYASGIADTFRGPRILTPAGELIAPDLFVSDQDGGFFAGCKAKDRFSWFAKTRHWQTGIDQRAFYDYANVQARFGYPVYIFFLHQFSDPSADDIRRGADPQCPTGLYFASLTHLVEACDHTLPDQYGTVMWYWNVDDLDQLATLQEFMTGVQQSYVE